MSRGITIGIVGIIIFLVLLFMGMNIGLAMLFVGFVGLMVLNNYNGALGSLRTAPVDTASKYSYIVIPLFILMGNFAFHAGLSGNLYNWASKWLSRLPGGLACATVAACAVFGAICGSTAATAATMGAIALPEMRARGYDDRISTGALCIGGTLGVMIPPSTPMIIYAIIAECSIGKLFSAGIIPGIILAVIYIIIIAVRCTINKDLAPAPTSTPWSERFKSLIGLIPVVILFGFTLGGMFSGLFSVNQASCIGAALALIIMIVNKKFTKASFMAAMKDTVTTTSMTMLIMMGAMVFCQFLARSGLPSWMADTIGGLNVNKFIIIIIMTFIYMILGMFMDGMAMTILTVPIFLPIITALGWNPIWFGIYIICVMEMGCITPPVGLNLFVIYKTAKDVPPHVIWRGAAPYIVALWAGTLLFAAVPQIVTFIPDML